MTIEAKAETRTGPLKSFFNREMSWLAFARRVLGLVEDGDLPLLERIKFAGIMGMLHDEFFMKRVGGLKRQIRTKPDRLSIDGQRPAAELVACRAELLRQSETLSRVIEQELRPALAAAGTPILDWGQLKGRQQKALRRYFKKAVEPILTPLAVDAAHPFPFISNLGLNLAVRLQDNKSGETRFVRIKVPGNRPRWVPLEDGSGFCPLEQVIASNMELMFPDTSPESMFCFRVTRGAEGDQRDTAAADDTTAVRPGSIVDLVSTGLKARRFAGVVRLQVDGRMPAELRGWLAAQLKIEQSDVYANETFLGISDMLNLNVPGRDDLKLPAHEPITHPRLRNIDPVDSSAIFSEIARGDILLHHPYHDFDTSVLRFIESAARDRGVLAIKLTIYRTSAGSPIVKALAEAARRGKQVAVLVEVTARFDEAPNIEWGQFLEKEGVHVAYGVEELKTHVKLALVIRDEAGELRRYAHVGTGNYHTGTARIYEDLGVLTCSPEICKDVAAVFNALTGGAPHETYDRMLVAPETMRSTFTQLIRREAQHAKAGRPSGIKAKMNQLQDLGIMRELYAASRAGVPISLNVRGLCCLRPGVPGLSENIRVFSVVGRFLEHSRLYRFENGGEPEYFIGSADWMKRNLNKRVETVMPVLEERLKAELNSILEVYETDNCSAWDCGPDGTYARRNPAEGAERLAAQEVFSQRARKGILG